MSASLRLTSVTLGCPDPAVLAGFYTHLLGAELSASEPGWSQIRTPTDESGRGGLTLNFELEQCWTPPVWPAVEGKQFASQHLDIWVDDLDEAVTRAQECGARLADHQALSQVRGMFDPAGHPFCLFT